jgi:hypothetical protein
VVTGPPVASPTPPATHPPATDTAAALPPATSTSAPQVEYRLQMVKKGKDGLFLLNVGQAALPLERIRLGTPTNYILGTQWELSALQPGKCVLVKAEGAKGNKFKNVDCERVGSELSLPKGKQFWSSLFVIYFDGDLVGMCEQASDECEVSFPEPP